MEKHKKFIKLGNIQQINSLLLRSLFYFIKNKILRAKASHPSKIILYLRIFIWAFIALLFFSSEIPYQLMLDLDKDHKPRNNVVDSKVTFAGKRVFASIAVFLSSNELFAETKNYKVYRNLKFNYSIEYPFNWYPSGIVYSNAFEIRNYEVANPQLVPERNRATVIVVDTTNSNSEATDKFLDGFFVEKSISKQARRKLKIDGHRAVRIRAEVAARPIGPGASKTSIPRDVNKSPNSYVTISTYIADGKHLVSVEASAPANSDASVKEEIIRISDSVKFGNLDSKKMKGGTE